MFSSDILLDLEITADMKKVKNRAHYLDFLKFLQKIVTHNMTF
jgi:hypothetical protein